MKIRIRKRMSIYEDEYEGMGMMMRVRFNGWDKD